MIDWSTVFLSKLAKVELHVCRSVLLPGGLRIRHRFASDLAGMLE